MILFVLVTLLLLYIVRGKGNRVTTGLQDLVTQLSNPLYIILSSCYLLFGAKVTAFSLLPGVVTKGNKHLRSSYEHR